MKIPAAPMGGIFAPLPTPFGGISVSLQQAAAYQSEIAP